MSFTGNEDQYISLQDAAVLTKNYRDAQSSSYIKGEFFGKDGLESVLDQSGCVGLRIYYGLDENDISKMVIVGVTSNENDMTDGYILEMGRPCPVNCSSANPLNSDPV